MTDKLDSSLARMLGVLDLFSDEHVSWTAEAISDALQVSRPTGYRYVRLLSEAGLLQRTSHAQWTLGPRIIVLDHYIRQADPVLQHAVPFMKELVQQTGLDCVLSSLYGQQLLDTHREFAALPANLNYGRGRPRPLFLGAAPKVILASLGSTQLHKLLDGHHDQALAAGLPGDWPSFRRYFGRIRKAGFYFSSGELESDLAAVAAPIHRPDGTVVAAISLVTSVDRMAVIDTPKLSQLVIRSAQEIGARMA